MIVFVLAVVVLALLLSLLVKPMLLSEAYRWEAGAEERAEYWRLVHAVDGKLLVKDGLGFNIIESRYVEPGTAIIIDSPAIDLARPMLWSDLDTDDWRFSNSWPIGPYVLAPHIDPRSIYKITGI